MITFLLLSLLVLLHELGHFLAAKKFGVRVEEFGIGLPPKALTLFTRKGTEYTLNWLPIGGFVRLLGEDADLSLWEKVNPLLRKQALFVKPAWQRAVIMAAGVVMNFLVGILLFSVVYSVSGVPVSVGEQVVVTEVAKGSPADLAGIKAGDVVRRVAELPIASAEEFVGAVAENRGQLLTLYLAEMSADGTTPASSRQVNLIPREDPPEGEGALGVGVVDYPQIMYEKKEWYVAPLYGVVEGTKEAYGWTRYMIELLLHPKQLWEGIGGPVKVLQIGQEQAQNGWLAFLRFGGVISFNLAVFNLLPLPALDGGRILFLLVEKVVGKKKTAKVERFVHGAGILLLIGLLLVVTVRDLIG